ncbi:MAG TPA: glycosyltransferase family 4 protein [Magnetospirillum sp.]|jgi:glycosyltransferase involved in cell wall biosynthesis|nr:glycosyltransferase family 4 protein [Magnetospirillum sp.]
MRILHTIPGRNWGGMEHRTLEQVRWLMAHGHDVWLAAPPDGEPYARAQAMGLPVVPMCFDPPMRAVPGLRRLIKDKGIEVMDAHVTRDAKAGLYCLDLCAQVRSRHVNQYLKPSFTRRLQWRLSDHVITVAECTRQDLVRDGIIDADRSCSIGGWADERFFDLPDPVATRARLRGEIGLKADEFVLVCVGMLRPDKGQDHLIRALGLLKRRGIAITAVLAGSATAESAEYEAGLKRMAAEEGVTVHFLGYRDDVSELMQTGDIVVIPSLTEAQPRVAVQAFATGRPVVASAVGGVPEIVHDGETGWLVPPAQPEILADAIARVVQHPDEAARVAQGARQLAEQRMRFDHRMAETLETYRVAIERAKNRPILKVRR